MHLRAYNYCATRSSWYYGMYKYLYTCRYSMVNTMLLRVCVAIDWHTDKKWHIFMAIRDIGNVETLFSNATRIRDPWKLLSPFPPPPEFSYPCNVTESVLFWRKDWSFLLDLVGLLPGDIPEILYKLVDFWNEISFLNFQ